AIAQRDYTVMQGIFLIITFSVIFANFFADILYSWLDPRIKLGKTD
ncbi:MAG: ABC transporter permease subunit, partial [Caldilineaceae bacterium]|nr:ABC transporter permease subunit [Caldilineaceae bacterium]